ncbi:nucleoside-diphosphate kinase [Streptomyces sp. SP18CS02]|uniref:nucleoside-diphosphate kinase n=1 Tax=Streptomyces sp. SP18CS02 TaxID=3002531 RepID=UPI002E796B3C|nr:nucleoside-diphosphate kinase [Streptomyces sp. SP18CS02]MEE1752752.1 nucleoside-diphosphate kinase [Streptomyces sp. SP18CS02]
MTGLSTPDWDTALFAMITPDAIARGVARAIVDRLEAGGFTVGRCRVIAPSHDQVDSMTGAQITGRGQVFRARALHALFDLGPSLALTLVDTRSRPIGQRDSDAARLKGAAPPAPAQPGSIRHGLCALNTVLSLLHIADSGTDSRRESAILAPGNAWLDGRHLDSLLELLTPAVPERRGHREVVRAVHGRLIATVGCVLDPETAARLLEASSAGPAEEPRLAGVLTALEESADPERAAPFARLLRHDFTTAGEPIDIDSMELLLGTLGVGLDAWERAVLETSQHFHPPHAANRKGARDASTVAVDRSPGLTERR